MTMKTIRFFTIAAMAAATLLTSCSKDDTKSSDSLQGKAAKIKISIEATETRAIAADGTEELAPGHDKTITNFYVFALTEEGSIINRELFGPYPLVGNSGVSFITSTAAKEIYVVANEDPLYDAILADEDELTGITTRDELEALIVDLAAPGMGEQILKRWITGSKQIDWAGGDPTDPASPPGLATGTAKVCLKYIASRITVKVVNKMDPDYTNGGPNLLDLRLTSVTVLNAMGNSRLFDDAPIFPGQWEPTLTPTPAYYSGVEFADNWAYQNTASTRYDALSTDFTYTNDLSNDFYDESGVTNNKNVFYFYVFPREVVNAPEEFPTIVTLCGLFGEIPVYFPAHLADYDLLDAPMERGKSYDITMTLNGNPLAPGGGGGSLDPTIPNANVIITLCVRDWIPVPLVKEFY